MNFYINQVYCLHLYLYLTYCIDMVSNVQIQ